MVVIESLEEEDPGGGHVLHVHRLQKNNMCVQVYFPFLQCNPPLSPLFVARKLSKVCLKPCVC